MENKGNCMKKVIISFTCILLIISVLAYDGMSISNKRYNEISKYVLDNQQSFNVEEEIEFFDYESTGLSVGGVYYGYYYTENNIIAVPDFYSGDNLGSQYEADGGTYFGKPNDGTDWCFIKKITDNWYYFELHWG